MSVKAQEIVNVLAEVVPEGGATLAPAAREKAQVIQAEIVPRLEANPLTAQAWHGFQADPQSGAAILASALQLLLAADVALAQKLELLIAAYNQAARPTGGTTSTINTGGGAYIGGGVTTSGGDFVGRDKVQITGDGNVVGDHSSATVIQQSNDMASVAAIFEKALTLAKQQPVEVREDVEAAVETAKEEAEKGEGADKSLLNKALDVLLDKGPDVLELVLDAILNPGTAAGKGAKMLAKQARGALEKKRKVGKP